MVVYQVGTKIEIDVSFLKPIKQEQIKAKKGVYRWYVLRDDLKVLFSQDELSGSDQAQGAPEKIYLYIGTVADSPRASVTARFLGELCGASISTKGKKEKREKFDSDFAVSYAIALLDDDGIDVYFDLLCERHGREEEKGLVQKQRPILQKDNSAQLHSHFKREIKRDNLAEELEHFEKELLGRLKQRYKQYASASLSERPRMETTSQ